MGEGEGEESEVVESLVGEEDATISVVEDGSEEEDSLLMEEEEELEGSVVEEGRADSDAGAEGEGVVRPMEKTSD